MDAQILQELIWIRWLATVGAGAGVVFAIGLVVSVILNYRHNLQGIQTNDFFTRGNALLMKGQLDELLALCDKHLLKFPADGGAHWLKANVHYRRKEWTLALISYRKADELQPGWALTQPISEIEEKIANAAASPELKVIAPVTPIPPGGGT